MDETGAGLSAIGNTPIVRLGRLVPDGAAEVWVKLEGFNPTGSYKDRMAISVLWAAWERGDVKAGDTVVEFTGGSTGTALAFVCAVLGLKFTAVFSDAFSHSKQQAMEAFGATVFVEASHGGGITHELAERMKDRAYALADQPGHYYADQFGSADVRARHLNWRRNSGRGNGWLRSAATTDPSISGEGSIREFARQELRSFWSIDRLRSRNAVRDRRCRVCTRSSSALS